MIELTDLPDGWIWAELRDLALNPTQDIVDGPFGSNLKASEYIDKGIPIIRLQNIDRNEFIRKNIKFIDEQKAEFLGRHSFLKGDIVITKLGDPLGKACLVPDFLEKGIIVADVVRVRNHPKYSSKKFLIHLINSSIVSDQLVGNTKGTTRPRVNLSHVRNLHIPLPPLNEQRRIVSTIEQLTDRSHKARAALEDVPKLIEQFRQSVLAAAFRGDLTADWREKNPDNEWQTTILDEIIHGKPRNGYSPKPVDFPTSVKSLTLSSTTSGVFKPEHFKYINEDISKDSYLWLIPGDILLQRGNTLEYVGTSAIYTGELFEFIYPDLMIKLQIVKEKALPEFIHYQLSSEATRKYFKSNATGTAGNMPKINQKIVMETPIFLPSLKEQLEIVKKIKQMFDGIELLKNICIESDEELNQLDRSILAKAFRGELVPQDPNDEPAAVLLERIRAEREQTSSNKQRGKTTRKNSSKQLSIDLE